MEKGSTKVEESKKVAKFAIVGVLNTLISWVLFIVLNWLGVYYLAANIIANSIAVVHSYLWNSIWVFKYKGSAKAKLKASIKFILLNVVGIGINALIMYVAVDFFNLNKLIAMVVATGFVMVLNYVVNRLWVFKEEVEEVKEELDEVKEELDELKH
ncbi:GtrA family protein [Clostridium chrysemydis]|uniref:GtrA family protein n=1 Tax=Clostridium chrysemydis TaxID=2665504 RepID=UPI0018833354|nr:GtrA family protein [Clostridium chrysemydis]